MSDIVKRLRLIANGFTSYLKNKQGDLGICDEAADEIERLRNNAKKDAEYLMAYHRICEKHGFAPSSSDLIAALKEKNDGRL